MYPNMKFNPRTIRYPSIWFLKAGLTLFRLVSLLLKVVLHFTGLTEQLLGEEHLPLFEITCLPIFYIFPDFSNTECLATEINSSKIKWFMTCSHNCDKIRNLQHMMNLNIQLKRCFAFNFQYLCAYKKERS